MNAMLCVNTACIAFAGLTAAERQATPSRLTAPGRRRPRASPKRYRPFPIRQVQQATGTQKVQARIEPAGPQRSPRPTQATPYCRPPGCSRLACGFGPAPARHHGTAVTARPIARQPPHCSPPAGVTGGSPAGVWGRLAMPASLARGSGGHDASMTRIAERCPSSESVRRLRVCRLGRLGLFGPTRSPRPPC
jgi:hypothetical protein